MCFWIFCLFFMFGVFPEGVRAQVQTHQTVMAAVGEEAHLSCLLTESKDVVQVTWKKVLPDQDKNVATYYQSIGQQVNSDFRDKVRIEDVGLQSSSIVIRDVSEQDGGCYRCVFYSASGDSLSATTCLQLHVRVSSGPEKEVFLNMTEVKPTPDGSESASGTSSIMTWILLVPGGLLLIFVPIFFFFRNRKNTETLPSTAGDTNKHNTRDDTNVATAQAEPTTPSAPQRAEVKTRTKQEGGRLLGPELEDSHTSYKLGEDLDQDPPNQRRLTCRLRCCFQASSVTETTSKENQPLTEPDIELRNLTLWEKKAETKDKKTQTLTVTKKNHISKLLKIQTKPARKQ